MDANILCWIRANIWTREDRIPVGQQPARKTQNPPAVHFSAVQTFSHLVNAAVVRPGKVLLDGGDEGVVVEEARQPERGGKAGLQNHD